MTSPALRDPPGKGLDSGGRCVGDEGGDQPEGESHQDQPRQASVQPNPLLTCQSVYPLARAYLSYRARAALPSLKAPED